MGSISRLFVQGLTRRPRTVAWCAIAAMFFSAVSLNALVLQDGEHPAPIWALRDDQTIVGTISEHKVPTIAIPVQRSLDGAHDPIRTLTSRDQSVLQVQQRLARLGLYDGPQDGLVGPMTQKAVVDFQSKHGLVTNGEIGDQLLASLDQQFIVARPVARGHDDPPNSLNVTLTTRRADAGIVRIVQSALQKYGDEIRVDGMLGNETRAAISRFQSDYGLVVTGEPDAQLLKKLREIGVVRGDG